MSNNSSSTGAGVPVAAPVPESTQAKPATSAGPPTQLASTTTPTTNNENAGVSPDGGASRNRPCIALSQNLMALYKTINEAYFVQKRMEGEGPKYNSGYDDKDGHYVVLAGEEIMARFTVMEVLGKGSFGTVLKCFDEKRQETVALKIIRNGVNFRNQAKLEIDILLKLNGNSALHDLVVRLMKVFDWKGHLVLVFELLSFNLYQLIKCTRYNGVSLDLVRKFGIQLFQVLHAMKTNNPPIIHCDLKPENVLLKNQNRSGIRVVDYGSACYENRRMFKYIQSRYYRSPEVILNLEYDTSIDRWSLGCLLVELHVGVPLFDGRSEAQQLHKFQAILGPLPRRMIDASPKKDKFFNPDYTLKPPPPPHSSIPAPRALTDIIGVSAGGPGGRRAGQAGHDEATYAQFLDLVQTLLVYEPAGRIGFDAAFRHPFLEPLLGQYQAQQQQHQSQGGGSTSSRANTNNPPRPSPQQPTASRPTAA